MIDPANLLAIVMMASATYIMRISGYLYLRNRALSPRLATVLESAPGCVLITIISPGFVTGHIADALALVITALAATRFSMLPTVLLGILSAGVLRHIIGG